MPISDDPVGDIGKALENIALAVSGREEGPNSVSSGLHEIALAIDRLAAAAEQIADAMQPND